MPKSVGGKMLTAIAAFALAPFTGGASTFFYTLGANMILAGVAQRFMDKPRQKTNQDGIKFNFNGEESPLYLVFGQHRVGGHISVLGTSGAKNNYLHMGVTHSTASPAGMSDITDIWLDERKIDDTEISAGPGGTYGTVTGNEYFDGIVQIARYLGTDSETADSTFDTNIGYQDSNSWGRGLARTHVRLEKVEDDEAFRKAFPRGVPQLTALLQGRCYDPRLDSTNGGTGTHRTDDPDTWAFSQNPFCIAGTYAIMEVSDGGMGIDPSRIDWAVLSASANRCDETVSRPDNSGGTVLAARHTCNIVLSTEDECFDNMDKILSSCDGTMATGLDRKIKFFVGEYEVPVTTVDKTWLREGDVSAVLDTTDTQVFNAVRSRYMEPSVGWQPVSSVPYTNAAYEAIDGRREWKDIEIPATTDRYEAQYLNQIAGRKSRHQKSIVLPLNWKGHDIEIWENVTLDFPELGYEGVFKVVNWKDDPSGPVVSFLEQSSTAWDSDISDYTETVPEPPPGLVSETPPTPTGLSATATIDGISLSWNPLGPAEYAVIVVEVATSSGGSFSEIARVKGSFYLHALTNGEQRFYKIKAQSPLGNETYSAYSSEVSATAKLVADYQAGRGVNVMHPRYSHFSENDPPPIDTNRCTITRNGSSPGLRVYGDFALAIVTGSPTTSVWAFMIADADTYNLYLRPRKYIISAYLTANGQNANSGNVRCRVRRSSDGTYRDVFDEAVTTVRGRYSGVVDLSGDTDGETYSVSFWVDGSATSDIHYVDGVMIEEQYGNKTTPSDYSPPVGAAGDTAIAADEGRLADQRSGLSIVNANFTNGLVAVSGTGLLSGFDAGATATVRLKACTIQYGFGQVSYNQTDATGRSYDTKYYGYAVDRNLNGGTVTLLTSTLSYAPQSDKDYAYFGYVTTPSAGSGGTNDGGWGGICVAATAWIGDKQAKDIEQGEQILCWNGGDPFQHPVKAVHPPQRVPCVRIETETGAAITCSMDTPITQPDGRSVLAANIQGGKVLTEQEDGSFEWESVTREWIGEREVVPISVGGISFAASDERSGRRIITHNIDKDTVP